MYDSNAEETIEWRSDFHHKKNMKSFYRGRLLVTAILLKSSGPGNEGEVATLLGIDTSAPGVNG